MNPTEAYQALLDHRCAASKIDAPALDIVGEKRCCEISKAKKPMLDAIRQVLQDRREFWPLSDRAIHYALLNDPPLKHALKPDSTYDNTPRSYNALTELLTRRRLAGEIPMHAIADVTRPVITWNVHREPGAFIGQQLDGFLKSYWRDLLQSQPNHFEIVGEKNTVESIIRPVAMEYCIPLTIGRGYCSLPPRAAIADRYRKSGKEQLILLMLSDFDPDGEEIAHSLARSLRDDFDILKIHPIKVVLTSEQVKQYRLPPVMTAKEGSSHFIKFTSKNGTNVFELEALEPQVLQQILREAIDSVLNIDAINREIEAERLTLHSWK